MAKPLDIADAMAKAQLFEDRHDDLASYNRFGDNRSGWSSRTPHSIQGAGSFPPPPLKQGPVSSTGNNVSSPTVHTFLIKKLSPAELKDHRDKGLCFTCDEKFNFGHKGKNRMLILCGQDDDEVEAETENDFQGMEEIADDEVSLNSLSNSMNPQIFRIMAKHGT